MIPPKQINTFDSGKTDGGEGVILNKQMAPVGLCTCTHIIGLGLTIIGPILHKRSCESMAFVEKASSQTSPTMFICFSK